MRLLPAGLLLIALCSCTESVPVEQVPADSSAGKGPIAESSGSPPQEVDARQIAPSDVPPSYPLRFLDLAEEEPERWEARLVERDAHGRMSFWSWVVLQKGAPDPLMAYERVEYRVRETVELFVELRQRGGDWRARAKVPSARGVQPNPVQLELVQVAVFGGGVVDGEARPVMNTELRLYQAEGSQTPAFYFHPHLAWTNENGEFRFGGVEPGKYWLRVTTEGREPVVLQLELKGGDSEAYELKMSTLKELEELPIALLGVADAHLPAAIVTLRSLDGQNVQRVAHPRLADDSLAQLSRAGVGYAGLFPVLPKGRYELSTLGLDSHQYEPAHQQLAFDELGDGIRVQAMPPVAPHELRFEVRAKGSEDLLEHCYLRFSSDRWWAPESMVLEPTEKGASLSASMPTPEWMVGRVGYQPVFGRFAPPVDELPGGTIGQVVERIELVPGWGCELLFRDGSLRLPRPEFDTWRRTGAVQLAGPIEGVLVFADGEEVGRTDGRGRVHLVLERAPESLRFAKAGWYELPHYLTGFLDAHDLRRLEAVGSTTVWFDKRSSD